MSKENRLLMLDAYHELENQIEEVLRIIPLDNKDDIYSPRLYGILLIACAQVENMLKNIACRLHLTCKNDEHFPYYFDLLNVCGVLELQRLILKNDIQKEYKPFKLENYKPNTTFWWSAYNDSKHHLPYGFKKGNLKNTLNALAGLYSLHCIAFYAETQGKLVLEKRQWTDNDPHYYTNYPYGDMRPKSKIFYCLSNLTSPPTQGFAQQPVSPHY